MKKTILFLANGFEEIEALTVVDFFRRAGAPIDTCSIDESRTVIGAHQIPVLADTVIAEINAADYDCFVCPGGSPGAWNLKDNSKVVDLVRQAYDEGKIVAAICAGPIVLEEAGVLAGHQVTSYPGSLDEFTGFDYCTNEVVVSDNIITSRGVGTAFEFAFTILEKLGYETLATRESMLIK